MLDNSFSQQYNSSEMKYYYLDSEKKPQGPYSKSELTALMNSGVINPETLAACAGDNAWKKMSELLEDCSTWNNSRDESPAVVGAQKEEISLWGCFLRGFSKYAVFKGRASRKEFWGFYLFYGIFNYAFSRCTDLITITERSNFQKSIEALGENAHLSSIIEVFTQYLSDPKVMIVVIFSLLVSVVMFIPFLSISVRRLHDTGSGSTGVVFGCISLAAIYGCIIFMLLTGEPPLVEFFVSIFAFLIITIYLIVKMILPGNIGENKYGPESKF